MELDTVARCVQAFYRLVGTESGDTELTLRDEAENDVAYLYLTRGARSAQRYMLRNGWGGWLKRSDVRTWEGTDDANGGRYTTLPPDFLRAAGDHSRSPLVEPNGDRWGGLVEQDQNEVRGNGCYIRGFRLWLLRGAQPPDVLHLEYHYRHAAWSDSVVIDFPLQARWLVVAEAASAAKDESWLPGGPDLEIKIERAVQNARKEALDIARQTRAMKQLKKPRRYGNRW
jgi:hypothetical protein